VEDSLCQRRLGLTAYTLGFGVMVPFGVDRHPSA
jgi:hypothetical protein